MTKRPTACSTANRARPGGRSTCLICDSAICHSPPMKTRLLILLLSISVFPCLAPQRRLPLRRPRRPTSPSSWLRPPPTSPAKAAKPFRRIEELVRQSSPGARKQLEAGLVQLLAPTSTFEARRFACKQLGIIGSKRALPALADLLKSDDTAGIACLALTTYPPGKADEVLRAALPSATGHGPHPDHQHPRRPPGCEGGGIARASWRVIPIHPSPRPPSPRWARLATRPPGRPSPPSPKTPTRPSSPP